MEVRQSTEDYLEAMMVLQDRLGYIRAVDIANKLSVSKPSVSFAIKKLRMNGYVTTDDNGMLCLTDSGLDIAKRVYARHVLIAKLLIGLGVDEDIAMNDACRIEHYISETSFEAVRDYIEQGRLSKCGGAMTGEAYMSVVSQAMKRLRSLGTLTIDMLEAFIRGNVAELKYSASDAILLRHSCGIHMLWCSDREAGLNALNTAKDMSCCVCHGRIAHDVMREFKPDFTVDEACLQYCLASRALRPLNNNCVIRPLRVSEAGFVVEHYEMENDIAHVRTLIREGKMFGAEVDGQLAAFIGFHRDGSSGMLEVMPEFRRKGIGTELEVFFQNYQLERGWMPYGQVYITNTASLKMQSKLGLSVSEDCIWWIYEE